MSKITVKTTFILALGVLVIAACGGGKTPKTEPLEERDALHFSKIGQIVTEAAFKALSRRLQTAVEEMGTAEAVAYCNTAALSITDSVALAKQVQIKRTSLRLRNPKNTPTPWELEQLNQYKSDVEEGNSLSPVVKRLENGTIIYMEPIFIMPFCLQCHGKPAEDVAQKLKTLYPKDRAINYREGDLRGIWAVKLR